MSGIFGVDVQNTLVAITLLEGGGPEQAVGDGYRVRVPAACGPDSLWGSAAAAAALRGLTVSHTELADRMLDWLCDPREGPFLRGLFDRLKAYLGETPPTSRNGYQLCVSVGADDAQLVRSRCAEAGFTGAGTVRPTDALVCRWLTTPGPAARPVDTLVAVAGGETWTDVATYRVTGAIRSADLQLRPGEQHRVEHGCAPVVRELARRVLERSPETANASSLLAVLDGVYEFGGTLRVTPEDGDAEWNGALADRMFAPVRLGRAEMARWPAVAATTVAVQRQVDRMAQAHRGAGLLVLVGGIGATWPFLVDAVAAHGRVWHSQEPGADLAAGASWWPRLRAHFDTTTELRHGPALLAPPRIAAPDHDDPELVAPETDLESVPPWMR